MQLIVFFFVCASCAPALVVPRAATPPESQACVTLVGAGLDVVQVDSLPPGRVTQPICLAAGWHRVSRIAAGSLGKKFRLLPGEKRQIRVLVQRDDAKEYAVKLLAQAQKSHDPDIARDLLEDALLYDRSNRDVIWEASRVAESQGRLADACNYYSVLEAFSGLHEAEAAAAVPRLAPRLGHLVAALNGSVPSTTLFLTGGLFPFYVDEEEFVRDAWVTPGWHTVNDGMGFHRVQVQAGQTLGVALQAYHMHNPPLGIGR